MALDPTPRPKQHWIEGAYRIFGVKVAAAAGALWNAPAELTQEDAQDRIEAFLGGPVQQLPPVPSAPAPEYRDPVLVDGEPSDGDVPVYDADERAFVPRPLGMGGGAQLVETFGHSLSAGGGASKPEFGYWRRVAKTMQAAAAKLYGYGGAVMCWPTSGASGDGGYHRVLNAVRRSRFAGRYLPQSQVVIAHAGENDLARTGSQKLRPFEEAYRAILSRFCAAAVWENSDAHAAGSGGFTYDVGTGAALTPNYTVVGMASGPDSAVHILGVGNRATFHLPADYPGGLVVALGFFVNATWGATRYGVRVDGVERPDIVFVGSELCDTNIAAKHNHMVRRFGRGVADDPVLGAGAHTIELTVKEGVLGIDYGQVEADPLDGPIIVGMLAIHPPSYAIWTGFAHGPNHATNPINAAAIDVLRERQRAVIAEFGPRSVLVDMDPIFNADPKFFHADGVHWNDIAQVRASEAIHAAVAKAHLLTERVLSRPLIDPSPLWRKIGVFPNPSFANGWTNFGAPFPDFEFSKSLDGKVAVRGAVKSGSAAIIVNALPTDLRGQGAASRHVDSSAYGFDNVNLAACLMRIDGNTGNVNFTTGWAAPVTSIVEHSYQGDL